MPLGKLASRSPSRKRRQPVFMFLFVLPKEMVGFPKRRSSPTLLENSYSSIPTIAIARGSVPVGPKGEPAMTDRPPVLPTLEINIVLSLLVTKRKSVDGSTASAIGAPPAEKGEPAMLAKLPVLRSIVNADRSDENAFVTYRNLPDGSAAA